MAPDIQLSVNGVVKQNSSTNQMIFSVMELVAAASTYMTLEPGDVIATGTPAGVGTARNEQLWDGDEMIANVELLGSLRNPVRAC